MSGEDLFGVQPEQKIRKKIRQITYRILQKELERGLKVAPYNCAHNIRQPTDPQSSETVGVCGRVVSSKMKVMRKDRTFVEQEEDYPDLRFCDKIEDICPHYKPAYTKAAIKAQVEERLSDLEYVAQNHRDIAALRWVLDEAENRLDLGETLGFWQKIVVMMFPTGTSVLLELARNRWQRIRDRRTLGG